MAIVAVGDFPDTDVRPVIISSTDHHLHIFLASVASKAWKVSQRRVFREFSEGCLIRWFQIGSVLSPLQAVVNLIKTHFGHKRSPVTEGPPREIPLLPVPPHEEPRFSCFAEAEAGGVSICVLP